MHVMLDVFGEHLDAGIEKRIAGGGRLQALDDVLQRLMLDRGLVEQIRGAACSPP